MHTPPTFYATPELTKVMDVHDVGQGDRFYSRKEIRDETWEQSLKHPIECILITFAGRGERGPIRYVIESWNGSEWTRTTEKTTTQSEFKTLITPWKNTSMPPANPTDLFELIG
jgi:hypothetical protein